MVRGVIFALLCSFSSHEFSNIFVHFDKIKKTKNRSKSEGNKIENNDRMARLLVFDLYRTYRFKASLQTQPIIINYAINIRVTMNIIIRNLRGIHGQVKYHRWIEKACTVGRTDGLTVGRMEERTDH